MPGAGHEHQLLRLRDPRELQDFVHRRVSPAMLLRHVLGEVLRIVDQQVHALRELRERPFKSSFGGLM